MKEFKVNQEEKKERIDRVIANRYPECSRTTIQRWIEEKRVFVNQSIVKVSYKVQLGDEIQIEEEQVKEIDLVPQDIPLSIIYEDKDILVVNKQKGLVVHPANGNPEGTLVNAVLYHCKDSLSGIGGEIRPGIVHRLDKDTSRINYHSKKR